MGLEQKSAVSEADAVEVAGRLLGFLADNPEYLGRFLAETGIGPGQIRALAGERGFHLGLFDFAMADESLLLAFCETAGIRPTMMAIARHRLDRDGTGGDTGL